MTHTGGREGGGRGCRGSEEGGTGKSRLTLGPTRHMETGGRDPAESRPRTLEPLTYSVT